MKTMFSNLIKNIKTFYEKKEFQFKCESLMCKIKGCIILYFFFFMFRTFIQRPFVSFLTSRHVILNSLEIELFMGIIYFITFFF